MGRAIPHPGLDVTPRQKTLADAWIESGNVTQAAMKAYNVASPTSAASIGSESLRKPNVRKYIESVLAANKVTLNRAAQNINKGLDAEQVHTSPVDGSQTTSPDWNTRYKFTDMTLKLLNAYPASQQAQGASNHLHLHKDVVVSDSEKLTRILDED